MKNAANILSVLILVILSGLAGWLLRQAKYEDDNFVKVPREQWEAIESRSVIYIDTCTTLEDITTSSSTTQWTNGN